METLWAFYLISSAAFDLFGAFSWTPWTVKRSMADITCGAFFPCIASTFITALGDTTAASIRIVSIQYTLHIGRTLNSGYSTAESAAIGVWDTFTTTFSLRHLVKIPGGTFFLWAFNQAAVHLA